MAASKKKPKSRAKPASTAYAAAVKEIIDATPRDNDYWPENEVRLKLVRRRQPRKVADLEPVERKQLAAIFGKPIADVLATEDLDIEAAHVVDFDGVLRYRLYGWNYGVGYLMAPRGLDVIAFGSQHDLEHWNLDQRPIFFAMDEAMGGKRHGFRQPLTFCWWRDECWDEIAGDKPGTVGSEPFIRKVLAKAVARPRRRKR